MKHFFKIFVSLYLSIILSLSVVLEAFAYSDTSEILDIPTISQFDTLSDSNSQKVYATEDEMKQDYDIISEMETSYGKIYYMKRKWIPQTRASFWDVVDIGMAVSSWAKLFGEPNFENASWAVLDTVSLLPVIPSLRYAKNAKEASEMIARYAKQSQSNMQRVVNAFKQWKNGIQQLYRAMFFSKFLRFPVITIKRHQLERKFKHASDLRLTNKVSLDGIKEPERTRLLNLFQSEITKIIRNNEWIYEFSIRGLPTYTFISNGKLVHLRRDNFEFLSAYPLTDNVRHALWFAVKVTPTNPITINFAR